MIRVAKYLTVIALLTLSLASQAQVGKLRSSRAIDAMSQTATSSSSNYNGIPDTTQNPGGDTDTLPKGIIFETNIIPDSTLINSVNIFHLDPTTLKVKEVWHPMLQPTSVQLNDKIHSINNDYYLNTGNLGQACFSVIPKTAPKTDFVYQPSIYDGYGRTSKTVNFYQNERPFTSLRYESSTEKEYQLEVIHSQNITQRWNIGLQYNLINAEGLYSNQKTKNNYFDATTNYFSKNLRYMVKGGVVWQKLNLQENGGISSDSLFTNNIQTNRGGMPVNLYSAYTDYNTLTLFAQQSFSIARQPGIKVSADTTWIVRASDTIGYDTITRTDTIKDSFVVHYDTTIYSPHIFNLGAIIHNVEFNKLKHNYTDPDLGNNIDFYPAYFGDSTALLDSSYVYTLENSLHWTNDIYKDHQFHNPIKLYLGIKHTMVGIRNLLGYNTLSMLKPFARATISTKHFLLSFGAETVLSDSYKKGDYALTGNLLWQPDSNHCFNIFASLSGNDPDYFFHTYASNVISWDYGDYEKTHTQSIGVRYNYGKRVELSSTLSNVANNVWLGYDMCPVQTDKSAVLSQTMLKTNLQWGMFNWQSFNVLQLSSDDEVFRLPRFAAKHSLFVELSIFRKALLLQTGFDLRYNTLFYADAYSPFLGAFYQQHEYKVGNTLWADFFVSGQIKHAILYAKVLHINTLFEKNPSYFMIPHYPGQDFTVQWGVIWRFFD
ncbi:MAG: hypothetical protein IJP95_00375 [Bacteroidales bacterium]|nr:hypothetical protein [Bacteroidales bacterium]